MYVKMESIAESETVHETNAKNKTNKKITFENVVEFIVE